MIRACEKIKIDHRAKFLDKDNFSIAQVYFRFARFYEVFSFRCVARATFDRNLIHSADACFLVMVCVLHARASLLHPMSLFRHVVGIRKHAWNFLPQIRPRKCPQFPVSLPETFARSREFQILGTRAQHSLLLAKAWV